VQGLIITSVFSIFLGELKYIESVMLSKIKKKRIVFKESSILLTN